MNNAKHIILAIFIGFLAACNISQNKKQNSQSTPPSPLNDSITKERNKEAREDSLKMAEALFLHAQFTNTIEADYETPPVKSLLGDDAADDPAIWINKKDAAKSLIIGTNKTSGLNVYDIQGNELQFIAVGKVNNADVAYNFSYNNKKIDLLAASNRSTKTVDIFEIDGENQRLIKNPLLSILSSVDDVYGLCMYRDTKSNQHYVFVNGKNGKIEQWLLKNTADTLTAKLARSFWVSSQPEGMVADEVSNKLYVGVEEDAIYQFNALPADTAFVRIAQSDTTNANISYDIEGLTIYRTTDNKGYLIASIQGNFSYAVFDINPPYNYITSFTIKNGKYDGVEETDGIAICASALGEEFPKGMLVVQDGFNINGNTNVNQNFKIISADKVLQFLE